MAKNVGIVAILILASCATLDRNEADILNRLKALQSGSPPEAESMQPFNSISRARRLLFEKFGPVISRSDTLILFEAYDLQSAMVYGMLWTSTEFFNYRTAIDSLIVSTDYPMYSDFIISRILNKDQAAIEQREQEQGVLLGGSLVLAYYIRRTKRGYDLDTFRFNEFHDSLCIPYLNCLR
jgi:hypothetical protein